MNLGEVKPGEVVMIQWSAEPVQLMSKSFAWATVRSLRVKPGDDAEREISTGTPCVAYEGRGLGGVCACGCGRIVRGTRTTRKYATNACRIRVSKRNGRGNGNSPHAGTQGNANFEKIGLDFIEEFRR
jgi:hypothetical protein